MGCSVFSLTGVVHESSTRLASHSIYGIDGLIDAMNQFLPENPNFNVFCYISM